MLQGASSFGSCCLREISDHAPELSTPDFGSRPVVDSDGSKHIFRSNVGGMQFALSLAQSSFLIFARLLSGGLFVKLFCNFK